MKKDIYTEIKKDIQYTVDGMVRDIIAEFESDDAEEIENVSQALEDADSFAEAYYEDTADYLDCDSIINTILEEIRRQVLSHIKK